MTGEFTSVPTVDWDASRSETALAELVRTFPRVVLRVRGGCMAPALPEGSRVTLSPPHRARPRFGDVVLCRQGEGLRLHRLVWAPVLGGGWRTQADRATSFDPRIAREDVLGTVVAVGGESRGRNVARACASLVRSLGRALLRARPDRVA